MTTPKKITQHIGVEKLLSMVPSGAIDFIERRKRSVLETLNSLESIAISIHGIPDFTPEQFNLLCREFSDLFCNKNGMIDWGKVRAGHAANIVISRTLTQKKSQPEIVIVVEGGCVTEVFCNDRRAKVSLIDHDNLDDTDPDYAIGIEKKKITRPSSNALKPICTPCFNPSPAGRKIRTKKL